MALLSPPRCLWSVLVIILTMVITPQAVQAVDQRNVNNGGQLQVTPEMLKAKMEAISQNGQLDEASKTKILELYNKGLANLSAVQTNNSQAKAFVATTNTTPEEIAKIREAAKQETAREEERLQTLAENTGDNRSLKDLEQDLLKVKVNATELEAQVTTLTGQGSLLSDRPAVINQRLAEIKERSDAVTAALKTPSQTNDGPELVEAQNIVNQTRLLALQSEARMLNQEMVSMPVTGELLKLQHNEAMSRLDLARQQVQTVEAKVNRKRQVEAVQSVGEAKEVVAQMADNQPVLIQVAKENETLSEQLLTISDAFKAVAATKDSLEKEVNKVETSFATTRQKVSVAGSSQAQGLLLYDVQSSLPVPQQLARRISTYREMIAETGMMLMRAEEAQKKKGNIDEYINELTGTQATPDTIKALKPALQPLLANHWDLLDKIIAANRVYLGQLSEIELMYTNLRNTVYEFNQFLRKNMLWTRSTSILRWQDLFQLPGEIKRLVAPGQWAATGQALWQQVILSFWFIGALLCSGILLAARRLFMRQLETTITLSASPTTYRFNLPIRGLAMTALLALPYPLLIGVVGWRLHNLGDVSNFTRAVGVALMDLSNRSFNLMVILVALGPIAIRTFFWSRETVMLLHRETEHFMWTFLPIVFLTQIAFYANYRMGSSHVLGRLCILLALSVIVFFAVRVLNPKTGVWKEAREISLQKLLKHLYPLLVAAALILPLVMVVLVFAGYIYAVGALFESLIDSIWLSFGLVLAHQVFERWLVQSERQLALKKNWRTENTSEESGNIPTHEEELAELSSESRKMLDALIVFIGLIGVWLVWCDVLPALQLLNQYTLWTHVVELNGQVNTVPVTVADVGVILLVAFLAWVSMRQLPSLLTIILLKYLQISASGRYTVVTLTRYGVGVASVLIIADKLGFSWSQIQWLVAALGVGIGFGLQEVVANFISGIIILFERPFRVGDVVTVDNVDGVVTRIRIRATTIRSFDRKELLVPNKDFISGRLLNWSLSDQILRIILPVGVAYGSDVGKAMLLMRQAAENHHLVLDDPRPMVSFDSFGDNTLNLNLRCFIGSPDDLVTVRTSLHLAIDEAFRAAAINIAFPQRDVHLDTLAPLEVQLVRGERRATGDGKSVNDPPPVSTVADQSVSS